MIDNAVAHYEHLLAQEVPADRAIQHVRLRYGVEESVLRERIAGKVADHEATLAALAEARDQVVRGDFKRPPLTVLRDLYVAITGEDVDPRTGLRKDVSDD